jgi:hypothetical protein
MRALIILIVLAAAGGTAAAYPQFQLSQDTTCSGCHISPAGGGLLSENGANTAEGISALGQNPEFMYGAIDLPEWLALGGDIRGQGGYLQAPQRYLWAFPMQGELYAAATKGNFSLYVNAGLRPKQEGNETATYVWSREHYVQWQQEAGAREGLFARAGHFMPVFGLRFVEHPMYTRRFGGTPFFSETYGLSASLITSRFEAHVSGFVKNPLIDPVRHENGGAVYGELRLSETTQVGAGGMVEVRDADWYTFRGAFTAKHYLDGPAVLLQGELQVVNPHVATMSGGDTFGHTEIVSTLMATYLGPKGLMIDGVFGHYDKNIRVRELDKDAFDVNLHWFATSHIELLLVNRVEFIQWGKGGPTGAWSMLQLHYRL